MKALSSKTKIFIHIYLSFIGLHIFGYFARLDQFHDSTFILAYFTLCVASFYAVKTAPSFHRLLFWVVSFVWLDFICNLLYLLIIYSQVQLNHFHLILVDYFFALPSIFLLIICLEIFYLIRERLNYKFFLINILGISVFFMALVHGIISHHFSLFLDSYVSNSSFLIYALDTTSLVILISILSSLFKERLNHSVFLTLMGVALFCVTEFIFFIVDTLYPQLIIPLLPSLASTLSPLVLIYGLLHLIDHPSHLVHPASPEKIESPRVIILSKTKIHIILFTLSCLVLFLGLVDFSTFSYMNLILLIYFMISNSYLISIQNRQFMKEQRELHEELKEKVKLSNIEILKQNIKLQDIVNHDLLTNAYNRHYFQELLSSLSENIRLFAVDIAYFSNINQIFGDAIGDEVLIYLYQCLRRAFPNQFIFRVDSDEYVILIHNQPRSTQDICNQIFEAVKAPFVSEFYTIPLNIYIGVAEYSGNDIEDKPENLLMKVNFALNEIKSSHIFPPVQIFDQALADKKYRHGLIQSQLDSINFDEEFILYFQPQYSADGQTLTGAEALLRWFSPKLGPVSPGEFIPIAEESANIIRIVNWTLKKACQQAYEWEQKYGQTVKIGVNVSPKYIEQAHFYDNLESLVLAQGWKLNALDLEITETSVMHLDVSVTDLFQKLSDMGVSTSIDDFGTGYSSLSYIKNLKISTLKIAKELIDNLSQNPDDELIINAIIKMAQGLNIKTIAEGIETRDQAAILQRLGCDQIQGYYFGPPVPPEEFVKIHL